MTSLNLLTDASFDTASIDTLFINTIEPLDNNNVQINCELVITDNLDLLNGGRYRIDGINQYNNEEINALLDTASKWAYTGINTLYNENITGNVAINTTFCPDNVSICISGTLSVDDIIARNSIMNIACNTQTSSLNIACGNALQSINIGGNGTTFQTTINIGGANDIVNIAGSMNFISTTNLAISDKLIQLNAGSLGSATARNSGILIRDSSINNQGFIQTNNLANSFEFKAPENGFILSTPILTANSGVIINQGSQIINGALLGLQFNAQPVNNDEGLSIKNPIGNSATLRFIDDTSVIKGRIAVAGGTSQIVPNASRGDLCLRSEGNSIYLWNTNNNNNYLKLDTNGNVGINTQPNYKLDISGTVNTNSNYFINGSQISTNNVLQGTNNLYSQWRTTQYLFSGTGISCSFGVNLSKGLVVGNNTNTNYEPSVGKITIKDPTPTLELSTFYESSSNFCSIQMYHDLANSEQANIDFYKSDNSLQIINFSQTGNIKIANSGDIILQAGGFIKTNSIIDSTNDISVGGYLKANFIEANSNIIINDLSMGTNSLLTKNIYLGQTTRNLIVDSKDILADNSYLKCKNLEVSTSATFNNAFINNLRVNTTTFSQNLSVSGLFVSNNANIQGSLIITGLLQSQNQYIKQDLIVNNKITIGNGFTPIYDLHLQGLVNPTICLDNQNVIGAGDLNILFLRDIVPNKFGDFNYDSNGNFNLNNNFNTGKFIVNMSNTTSGNLLEAQNASVLKMSVDKDGIVKCNKILQLNAHSTTSGSARIAGIQFRDNNIDSQGHILTNSSGNAWLFKAPENNFTMSSPLLSANSDIVVRDISTGTITNNTTIPSYALTNFSTGGGHLIIGNFGSIYRQNALTLRSFTSNEAGIEIWNANTTSTSFINFKNGNTENMRILQNGNVLIGTTSDSGQKLNINGGISSTHFQRHFDLRNAKPSDVSANLFRVGFGCWNNNNASPFADEMLFNTWSDGSAGNVNMLSLRKDTFGIRQYQGVFGSTSDFSNYRDSVLVDSTGLSNIGNLNIGKWGFNTDFFYLQNSSLTNVGDYALAQSSVGRTLINSSTNQLLEFRINNSPKMVINNNNIGIGTSVPSGSLDVVSTISTGVNAILGKFSNNLNNRFLQIETISDGSTNGNNLAIQSYHSNSTSNYWRLCLNPFGGNVGIGTSNPNYPLHIHRGTASTEVRIQLTDGTTTSAVQRGFNIVKTSSQQAFLINYENQPMFFYTNNLERATITSDGNFILNNSLRFQNGGNTDLSHYEEVLLSTTFRTGTSGGTTSTISIKCIRVGKNITLTIPNFLLTCTSTNNYIQNSTSNLLGANFRPVNSTISLVIVGTSSGSTITGRMDVLTTGEIRFYSSVAGANFTALTNNNGLSTDCTISYNIN